MRTRTRGRHRNTWACTALLVTMILGSFAQADVIYSNLTVDGEYNPTGGQVVRGCCTGPNIGLAWAVPFVPDRETRLDRVELAISATLRDIDDVEVRLLASDSGSPGATIEILGTATDLPPFGSSDSILTPVTSTTRPLLAAGTEYFIAVYPADDQTDVSWNTNVTGQTLAFLSVDEGPWNPESGDQPALRVSGSSCGTGGVNAENGLITNVLFINGVMGGSDRTVQATDEQLISVSMLKPIAGGTGKFVLHANVGDSSAGTPVELPFDVGLVCFPFLFSQGAAPVIVANNIGKTNQLGQSSFFGGTTEDPAPAPTTYFYPNLPLGTVLTFQGVILDPASASARGASATNAVTLEILP